MLSARADSVRHARAIDGVKDPHLRAELIRAIVEEGASFPSIQARIEEVSARADSMKDNEVSAHTDTSSAWDEDKALAQAQVALDAATRKLQNVARWLPNDGSARDELARRIEGSVTQLQELVALLRG